MNGTSHHKEGVYPKSLKITKTGPEPEVYRMCAVRRGFPPSSHRCTNFSWGPHGSSAQLPLGPPEPPEWQYKRTVLLRLLESVAYHTTPHHWGSASRSAGGRARAGGKPS